MSVSVSGWYQSVSQFVKTRVERLASLFHFFILRSRKSRIPLPFPRLDARITHFSALFLGKPYLSGAQGEGEKGEFDQSPVFRFDAFDCLTYVNNVLALALSENESDFLRKLLQINYYEGVAKYENRFHFMSIDWNPQNQNNTILIDITETVGDVLYAEGEIDKPGWFLKRTEQDIKLKKPVSDAEKKQLLSLLQAKSAQFKKEMARVPYLPLKTALENQVLQKIPHESIIEIVRPNWQLKEKIGTNLHISHLGFAIRRDNQLFFRHASSEKKQVVEVLLVDYLRNCLSSETIKGINIQKIAR